ncbi:MAG: phage baseplate protein [Elusimicrobiaceae bacterium]
MPSINLFNLGLNVSGTLINGKRLSLWRDVLFPQENKTKQVEVLTLSDYSSQAAKAAEAVNQFVNAPALQAATQEVAFTDISIKQESKLCTHPTEAGTEFADFAVFLPTEVKFNVILPPGLGYGLPNLAAQNLVKELQDIYNSRDFITIQTETDIYKNMVLISRPPTITAKNIDRFVFTTIWRQVLRPDKGAEDLTQSAIKEDYDAKTEFLGKLGV